MAEPVFHDEPPPVEPVFHDEPAASAGPIFHDEPPPVKVQQAPGFLARIAGGAKYDEATPEGMARIEQTAHEWAKTDPTKMEDRSEFTKFNRAKQAILQGVRQANQAGSASQFGGAAVRSALGANSLGAMIGHVPLRAAAAVMGEDSYADEVYQEALRDSYRQRAYNEQTAGWGSAGSLVGMIADPAGLAGGAVIGKGVTAASTAVPTLGRVLGQAGSRTLPQKVLASVAQGVPTGAVYGGIQELGGTGGLSDVAKAAGKGALVGTVLGAGGEIASSAAGKAIKPMLNPIREWLAHTGTSVQSRVAPVPGGIDTLQKLTASVPVSEQVSRTIGKLEATALDKPILEKLRVAGIDNLSKEEQALVLQALPESSRHVDAAGLLAHGNVMRADAELKAFAGKAKENLKHFAAPGDAPSPGKLSIEQLKQEVGPAWDKIKEIELGSGSKGKGIDKAIEAAFIDQTIPSSAKDALVESLKFKKSVYEKASQLAKDYGLGNAEEVGFSHREVLAPAKSVSADVNAKMMERAPGSESGKSRVVDVTSENVQDYSDFALPHYLENFAAQHLGKQGNAAKQLATSANKLPKFYEDLLKNIETTGQPPTASNAEKQVGQIDWFNKSIRSINQGQVAGGAKGGGANTAGLKNIMREKIAQSGLSKSEQELVMAAASNNIDRMVNPAVAGDILNAVRYAQRVRNSLSPGSALASALDPLTMISSGNLTTTTKALLDHLKVPQPSSVIKSIGKGVYAPVKTVAKAFNSGDYKSGAKEMLDHTTKLYDSLNSFMDEVSHNSSIRDIAFDKPNAIKWKRSVGEDVYREAVKEAKTWLATPKAKRPEVSGHLKQLVEVVGNEKLPSSMMGQTSAFNKLTIDAFGRGIAVNQSFMANKLANTIGLAKTVLGSTTDPKVRLHAAAGLVQLGLFTFLVEKWFFDTIHKAARNETTDIPDSESKMPAIEDVARFTVTPSVLVQGAKLAKDVKEEVESIFSGEDIPDRDTLVPKVVHDVSGFPSLGARAARMGYEAWKKATK